MPNNYTGSRHSLVLLEFVEPTFNDPCGTPGQLFRAFTLMMTFLLGPICMLTVSQHKKMARAGPIRLLVFGVGLL